MRRILTVLCVCMVSVLAIAQGQSGNRPPYIPPMISSLGWKSMLEQGKTWNYAYRVKDSHGPIDWTDEVFTFPNGYEKYDLTLKIDGTKIIDGKEYYCLYEIYNDADRLHDHFTDIDKPLLYLREDPNSSTLYYRYNKDKEYSGLWDSLFGYDPLYYEGADVDYMAFSMINLFNDRSFTIERFHNRLSDINIQDYEYQSPCGEKLNGYKIYLADKERPLIESVGFVGHAGIFVLGLYYELCCFADYCRFDLYSVIDGQGNVLYYDESAKPAAVEAVYSEEESLDVDYFDLQGRRVERPERGIVIERRGNEAKVMSR